MKQKVIEFFQNLPDEKHEQFNQAYELYRQSPTKNLGTERSLNVQGYSERGLENLLYDLQKMHGVTDLEKVKVKSQKAKVESKTLLPDYILAFSEEELRIWAQTECVEKGTGLVEVIELALADEENTIAAILTEELEKIEVESQKLKVESTEPIDTNTEAVQTTIELPVNDLVDAMKFGIEGLKNPIEFGVDFGILKQENENLASENEELQLEKEDLEEENEALKEEVEELKSIPKIDAQSIRVEFPFLSESNCPDEFKILVADKITAWNRYLELQEQIAAAERGEAPKGDYLAELAKEAVVSFDENQRIYDELNAYAETGKVLGKHPLFKRLQLTREVETMTSEELYLYKGSSAKYFTDNKKSLAKAEKAKNTAKILEINTRVAEREQKLALVNKRLGINKK